MFKKYCNSNRNLPPSPPSLPLIGHLHLLSPVITKCLNKISSKHGPFLHLRLGSRPFLVVSSAEFAAEIYKKHDITFSTKPKGFPDDSLLFGSSSFITAPYGDYWRFMKKLCVTDLLGSKQLRRSKGVRQEELVVFMEKLVEKAKKRESVEIGKEVTRLTNNIICRMLMSTRCSKEDDEAEKCRKLVKGSLDLAGKMIIVTMLGPFKKFGIWYNRKQSENIAREFHELFDKFIKEHEENLGKKDENKDLMDILLEVHNDPDAEFKISKTQIKAFLLGRFYQDVEDLRILNHLGVKISLGRPEHMIHVSWLPPLVNFVKVNIDGSSLGSLGIMGYGGIFNNYRGFPDGTFAGNIGIAFAFEAKLYSAIVAIQRATEFGWKSLWLKSDSSFIIYLLNSRSLNVPWKWRIKRE